MALHANASGGRPRVRRMFVFGGLLVLGLTPITPIGASGDAAGPTVVVREERGVYTVVARFEVPQPPAAALAVLTDYEQIPRFMPGVTSSTVHERTTGRAVVAQEAVSRMLMFSRRVHLLLEITETADTLRFRDRSGLSFARYEGAWRICAEDGHTAIQYELTAQPSFDVPEFLLTRLLRRDSKAMMASLTREIAARAAR